MRLLRVFAVFLMALFVALPAHAQSKVVARTGAHDGSTRLVFEWPEKPAYTLSKEGSRVLVRFSKAGALDSAAISKTDQNVRDVKATSSAGEPLQIAITIPDGSRFRDFIVENKLVIDVYASANAEQANAEQKTEPVKKEPEPAPVVAAASEPETPKAIKPKGDFSLERAHNEEAAPTPVVESAKIEGPVIGDHTVSFTSTFSVGMAAYERSGSLWIVLDTPDLSQSPVLEGPQKDQFGKVEPVKVENGSAYKIDIPQGMKAYGEGGGLSWKIVLTQKEKPVKPVPPLADEGKGDAELVWPMKSMRKDLTLFDPVVGDAIHVVTTGDAAQFAGPARRFVNLQTLNSVIGLAYVPKSDDIKAELNTQQVRVSKPGGLALSKTVSAPAPVERIKEEAIEEPEKEEAQKEETPKEEADLALTEDAPPAELPKEEHSTSVEEAHNPAAVLDMKEMQTAAEEKPSGNNIYNFPRWEMGGIRALDQNQHLMMVAVSGKEDGARDEDIITMAKMNLASNRGAEALGLLRVALQKVPELENNAEFQALRAAAFSLSGKYDEAIIDYARDDLKKYDDIKFWRVFTLAGLEDWKQAIEELPADISPIASYPDPVRVPLSLAFAEVALRSGKASVAQGILKTMEEQLPKLALPYASAWKYLSGEAERQSGKPEEAEKHWEPLVKNGKDDLFRAKAGLSLTKLQLDEKKLKPEEAVDRLEGLRYAWRGDELETLINYRLGQVYLDNRDYLKGLTVLRNATTLSRGTAINDEVRAYMVNNFRNIFSDKKLDQVSPLEAISLYEEFKDLTPAGPDGDKYVETLAERLVDADLLGRASALLEYHVNNRLKGVRKAEIAIRLAAIRLLDGNPDGAVRSLEIAQGVLDVPAAAPTPDPKVQEQTKTPESAKPPAEPAVNDPEKQRQIHLLRARALSMQKKPDDAMVILEAMQPDADVNRLRTDIAWTSGKWEEAAMALNDLISTEDISPNRPLTDYQRDIIFNRGIALSLSGNRVALANLRERYNSQMGSTPKGQMFEVVTRPRRPDMIGSREAIESMISEIDLFQGFLDGYSKMQDGAKPEAAKEPEPADTKTAMPIPEAEPAAAAKN